MKKAFTLLVLITLSIFTFGQDFESGDLNKKSYFRFGLSTPTYTNYGFSGKSDMNQRLPAFLNEKNPDINITGVEGRIGGILEVGTIFPLNGIDIADNMRLGINVDWLALKVQSFNLNGSNNLLNGMVASKVGIAFSYGLSRAIIFDAYGKVSPVWAGAVFMNHADASGTIDTYRGFIQFMYSTGINVKLSFIMLGFEYEFGGLRLKNGDGEYFGNVVNSDKRTPLNGFNATFGFVF